MTREEWSERVDELINVVWAARNNRAAETLCVLAGMFEHLQKKADAQRVIEEMLSKVGGA